MNQRLYNAFKALILVGLAVLFAEKLFSGALYYYIAPRFAWLTLVAVVLLLLLAQSYSLFDNDSNHTHHDHHHETSISLLAVVSIPLILGILVPRQPLGTDAVQTRGMTNNIGVAVADSERVLTIAAGERDVLDWVMEMNTNGNESIVGEAVDVLGFVYRDSRFSNKQFMVARFVLVCCVADASPIGLVVQSPNAADYPDDSWVQVQGVFDMQTFDGEKMPVIVANSVEQVETPLQPYLYP